MALIQAHLAEGNRREALRQFESWRRLYRDDLGLDPGVRLDELLAAGPRPDLSGVRLAG